MIKIIIISLFSLMLTAMSYGQGATSLTAKTSSDAWENSQPLEQIKFKLYINSKELKQFEGSTFRFKFVGHPMGSFLLKDLAPLVNEGDFLEHFYIFHIDEKRFSINNTEAFEVSGEMTLKRFFQVHNTLTFDFQGRKFPVEIIGANFIPLNEKPQSFTILDMGMVGWANPMGINLYILICTPLGLIIIFLFMKYLKRRKVKLRIKKEQSYWTEFITTASDRSEIERVYQNRQKWLKLFDGLPPEAAKFFRELNNCQYKENWSEEESSRVHKNFEKLQEKFQDQFGGRV